MDLSSSQVRDTITHEGGKDSEDGICCRDLKPLKSIRFGILKTWTICDGKITGEIQRPTIFTWVETFTHLDVCQFVVLSPNDYWELCTFKAMTSFFQDKFYD